MLVHEVMTTPAICVRDDDTIRYAADLLLKHRIASAPVLDADDDLVGVVSEADLLRGRTERDPRARIRPLEPGEDDTDTLPATVAEVMTPRPLSVRASDDTDSAARLLLDHGIKAVPVLDRGRVVGVVARRDLLRSLARPDEDVRRDVVALLGELGLGDDWDVTVGDGVVTISPRGSIPQRHRIAAVLARTVPGVVRVRDLS
jgi:CBS domain-containing protein